MKSPYSTTISLLLSEIEKVLVDFPWISAETFGWKAIGDSSLVARLRKGGDVTTKKLDMILQFIHNTRRGI